MKNLTIKEIFAEFQIEYRVLLLRNMNLVMPYADTSATVDAFLDADFQEEYIQITKGYTALCVRTTTNLILAGYNSYAEWSLRLIFKTLGKAFEITRAVCAVYEEGKTAGAQATLHVIHREESTELPN